MGKYIDITGQRFGRWTVINITDKRTKNRGIIWHCRCDCGNEKDVPGESLRRGDSTSCGCVQKEKAAALCRQKRLDLTGQRFGKLVALFPIYSNDKNNHTKWHCKCDCGNELDIDMGNLRQGFSTSCGCTLSKEEERIIKLLTSANIVFNYQHKFKDFPEKRFDFWINDHYIIEFDGQQHFSYSGSGWDTAEHYKRTHQSDLEKNLYCFNNNIPIIRIPYGAQYELKDLILDTSRFVLTPENEELYYQTH